MESPPLTNHEERNGFVREAPKYQLLWHRVDYETGKADQWHHAYSYDADNRITDVYTSTETPVTSATSSMASLENEPVINPLWDKEADYTYYAHGPLARTVLGDEEVQGLDYVYTLQGWVKSVNSNTLDVNRDPGEDGKGLATNRNVARDVYGYSLHYYEGDYAGAINGNNTFLAAQPMNGAMKQNSFDLFNGNIANMVTTITNPNTRAVIPLGNAYKYDQLNRLKEARSYNNINLGTNTWNSGGTLMYTNAFDYDANGNIIHQVRKDDANATIDDMSYYYENQNGTPDSKYVNPSMKVKRNRLRYVEDGFDYDGNDIDPGMTNTNYEYDAEGRLTKDVQERIDRITWNANGKVRKIEHTPGGAQKNLIFDYDASGHRIAKHVYSSNNVWEKSTYYVLDAQGNTMAVYQYVNDDVNHVITFAQTEKHIYGSGRLGINNKQVSMFGSQNATYSMRSIRHYMGKRTYELSNHLGNVLSVISDKVIPHNNGGTIDYWLADIRQATDYSPFGVILKNRDISLTAGTGGVPYRYGFQGQEMDNEVHPGSGNAKGNSLNFEYRMHDPRLGRFFAIDPLVHDYPELTPYQFSSNRPIDCREIEGMEGDPATNAFNAGYINAVLTNASMGLMGGVEAEDLYPKNLSLQKFYLQGQAMGDIVSIIVSGVEIDMGTSGLITAGTLAANVEGGPFTELAAIGVGASSGLTIAHAAAVAKDATIDLGQTIHKLAKMESSNSSGKNSSSQSNSGKKYDPKTKQEAGPSGKPKVHTVQKSTLKKTKDAARYDKSNGAKGTPVRHNKDLKGGTHYHNGSGVTGKGKDTKPYKKNDGKISNNVHYEKRGGL